MSNKITVKVCETEHFFNEHQNIANLKKKIDELCKKPFKFWSYYTIEMLTLQLKYYFTKFYLYFRKKQYSLKIHFNDILNNSRKKRLLKKHKNIFLLPYPPCINCGKNVLAIHDDCKGDLFIDPSKETVYCSKCGHEWNIYDSEFLCTGNPACNIKSTKCEYTKISPASYFRGTIKHILDDLRKKMNYQ